MHPQAGTVRLSMAWPGSCAVIAKEAAMIDTIRAFLYGVLILVAALIPPVVSLMQQFKS
jgi:hypothetical protein